MAVGYLLGIDIGTYESKAVLTTTDGRVVSVQVKPHGLSIPRPGWAEHDAERDWWGDFCFLSRRVIADSGIPPTSILGVGCSAIGPDMLPVDANCRPLRPAVLYGIDTRATKEIADLEDMLGREQIFQRCGTTLSAQSVGPKILWLRRNEPEIYEKAHKFVSATTFLVAKLTGRYVIDHYSCGSFDPMYDVATGTWAPDLCEPIVEPERLPEVVWTTEVVGRVTSEAAAETGLAAGTPVIAGTIDAAAEAVSAGVVAPGDMMLMYGTTLFMIQVLDRRMAHPQLWSAPYVFPSSHAVMAGMATSGALTRWFRDNFARELLEEESRSGRNAYELLAAEAREVPPGAGGLVVLPYFSGERTPLNDPQARGLVFGLTLSHSRAHLYRAVLESVGYGIRHHLDVLREAGMAPRRLRAVGGGTKNPLWLQVVSDICGQPQEVPEVTTGAAYGDAFLAGLGVGVFSSHEAINTWVRERMRVEPDPANTARYEPLYEIYRELYRRNKDLMHELSRLQ